MRYNMKLAVFGRTHGEVVPIIWHSVLPETGGELESELVSQTHWVELSVHVQDQVHLETLTLTKQPRD